jgi:hypothetical protein
MGVWVATGVIGFGFGTGKDRDVGVGIGVGDGTFDMGVGDGTYDMGVGVGGKRKGRAIGGGVIVGVQEQFGEESQLAFRQPNGMERQHNFVNETLLIRI